jgi:hypothetical protein
VKFFRKARLGREFLSPQTPFLPAPAERWVFLPAACGGGQFKNQRPDFLEKKFGF